MEEMISISKASKILGVDVRTLQRWDNDGKLTAYRTLGGHRRYKLSEIESLISGSIKENTKKNVFIYCRVSTKKQADSGNLKRQKDRLVRYCNDKQYNIIHIFEEIAGGLNDKRRELTKMLKRLNDVDTIVIEYPDRLARFGYNYIVEFCKSVDVSIETVEQNKELEPNEEMVNDLISIVTCFSAKLYGSRGAEIAKQDIEKTIKELEKQKEPTKEKGENSENNN
ncbi:MAG: IS607 family transposase [Natronincolaceae bacterium]|jgi:putative resolvase|nr:IS607 family transposase [Bacillota bacterium]NLK90383.1 IS607 family transposase [Clostridiales bacterium]